MKNYLFTLLLICLFSYWMPAQNNEEREYDFPVKFDPERKPEKDLKAAINLALKINKRILLDVGDEWCIWCHYLDDFFEKNKDINEFMHKNFIVLKINFSPENENKKFLSKYPEIPGYPHIFVLDKNGEFLHSQGTAELEKGRGHDREKVFNFLKKWAPEKNYE